MLLKGRALKIWTNRAVPSNDGGISLGQAAMAAFGTDKIVSSVRGGTLSALRN